MNTALCLAYLVGFAAPAAAADVWVTSTADSGAGSLRQAIADADIGDIVRLGPELSYRTITLASPILIDKDLVVDGIGARGVTISGNDVTRIFDIGDGFSCNLDVAIGYVRLVNARVDNPDGNGGAIRTCATALLLEFVSIEHVQAIAGAGLYQTNGFTEVRDVHIRDAQGLSGAAVMLAGGFLMAERVTISGSTAAASLVRLENSGATLDTVTLFDNVTTAGNVLEIRSDAVVEIQNGTIAGNRALDVPNAPAGILRIDGELEIRNSIIANPNGSGSNHVNCDIDGAATFTDLGNNLQFGDTSCGFATTGDPQFGTFGIYGSWVVPVLPIADTSPARDAGDDPSCPAFDGRGLFRIADIDDPCDIGAFEYNGPLTATVTNLNDDGPGSLRQTLDEAGFGATIDFQAGLTGTLLLDDTLYVEKSVTINGPGLSALTISPSLAAAPIRLISTGGLFCEEVITLRGFTLQGGDGDGTPGGAIANCTVMTVEDVRFTENTGFYASAVYSCYGTELTRVRFDNNAPGEPALRVDQCAPWVAIRDSSFIGNADTIAIDEFVGGTLLRNVTASGTGPTRLVTLADRTALEHVTFTGDVLFDVTFASLSVANSILVGGTDACQGDGMYEPRGYNVVDADCAELLGDGSSIQGAAHLAPAGLNAPGTVVTRGLTPASPAIDFSNPQFCPPTDARGLARPQGAACDAGAFEAHFVTLSPGTLPGSWFNTPFSTTLSTTGTIGAPAFAVTSGVLPPGLALDGVSGALAGTPTVAGTYTFAIAATDITGVGAVQSYMLIVDGIPTLTSFDNTSITRGSTLDPLSFTIGDDVIAPTALILSATSSNQALVPDVNLVFTGTGAMRTLSVTPIPDASGVATITVTVSDGVLSTTRTFTLTVMPVYYLAEGATGPFFDLDLLLANPHATPLPIEVKYLKDDGTSITQDLVLAPTSRTTIRVDEIAGLEATALSTIVTSPTGDQLVVERTMRWDASGYGAHTEKATAGVAPVWYFAEGSQGFFSTFILLANPDDQPNTAHVSYFRDGVGPVSRDYELPPTSRVTIHAGDDADLVDTSFGARVTFDRPGVAERAMYFGGSPMFAGGTASTGATAPATSWFLAEGATGSYFMTFVLLANPNAQDADVTVTYLPADGAPVEKTYSVPGNGRRTINVALEDASLASAAVATRVESTLPIVAERSQYWPQPEWIDAHNSFGVTATGTKWGLAEGRVGGDAADQTYILLANPGTTAADVTVTFLRADGTTLVKTFTVAPTSRRNIAISGAGSDVPELVDEAFGAIMTSTEPIAVERSMYSNANGVIWSAGTNATATRLP